MDSGGGHTHNEERGAEKLMDDYLKSIGLHRKKIAKDGSCLFRAVAEQVLHCQSLHTKVRAKCVEFLKQNRESYAAFVEGDFEEYLCKLRDPQHWVGEVEINALAVMYKRDFLIFQEPGKPPVNITANNFKDKVRLCFLNGNHYDSVYPVSHIKNAALCQSILYEVLYDGVFKVDQGSLRPCQRISRPNDLLSDDSMPACPSSDESDVDSGEGLWVENGTSSTTRHNNQSYRGRGRGRSLPERVRRSLNPTLLRNIEYDVWHKTKRAQQKMDYSMAAGMQYTIGDRCQVRVEGRIYNATIREVPPNSNQVMVYIEELGRRHVPLWSLRHPSEESSWSTVVNKDKRLSNGHGDWEERGKGRGRGKPVPSSSSVSQATAPGSSGRVLKQHSWPPQATVEEPGGSKTSRKSVSSADSALFGLTEEERLAKEEEERNVALVEIQLRDEHSFPALGTPTVMQGDGGKRKGAEKRRSQRNKTKSPVEDVRAASPSAGERPKSSTPPLTTTTAATANTNTTTPTNPTLPAAKPAAAVNSDSGPAWLGSLKAPAPNKAAAVSGSASSLPPASAAPTPKTNTQSFASAAGVTASPPPPPPPLGGALPPSVPSSATVFSLVTPVLPAATSPPTPPTLSSSSPPPSSLPPKSSASPPPPSSVPPPTFIAPIAPSPVAAQGFLPPSSLPRASPPVSSLPHSPSPPTTSSPIHHAAPVQEAPAPKSLLNSGGPLASQAFQSQVSLPQNQISESQTQASLPPVSQLQTQSQSEMVQDQPSLPPPGASYPQASAPAQPQPSVTHPHPPHPSQLPQTPITQTQTETPHPPAQPESPAHPPPPSHHPQLLPAHPPAAPPHPQSIPGAVPLQKLSQLYQDPLYPGFPQGEKGDVAQNPPFSFNKSGEDLPQDVNMLRFFFNLGIKAYTMPLLPPYVYLLPLQQAHTLHPKLHSRSPSPTPNFPPHSSAPTRPQETYTQYPPTSGSGLPQYDHQAVLAEPPRPSEPSFNQAAYAVTQPPPHRMPCPSVPWQQHQIPPSRSSSYQVGYHSPTPPYPVPPPSSQGYHPGQGPGHPMYPPAMPLYPPSSLGYQSSSAPEELQGSQGAMEQLQPANGDTMPGHGPGRVPGPLEGPAAANMANANNNRSMVVPGVNSFGGGLKKEQGESLTGTVLLVDPPLNNRPILVPKSDVSDVPVSMTTMKPGSTPGCPSPYDMSKTTIPGSDTNPSYMYRPRKPYNPGKPYVKMESAKGGYHPTMPMTEALSVACSTEDDWEEMERPPAQSHRGMKKHYRGGGRGRGGGYDGGRGVYRRRQGEVGVGFNHGNFGPSHRGQAW